MPVLVQIAAGSLLLVVCAFLHLLTISFLIHSLRQRRALADGLFAGRGYKSLAAVFLALLFSHTVQVYLWAFALRSLDALQGYEAPIYFALVSYTTLGYGDITLSPEWRIFGAMSSVTGILAFGMTTAFLVGLFSRLLDVKDH